MSHCNTTRNRDGVREIRKDLGRACAAAAADLHRVSINYYLLGLMFVLHIGDVFGNVTHFIYVMYSRI